MSWLEKIRPKGPDTKTRDRTQNVPEGVWTKCPKCSAPLYRPELEKNLEVCPKCEHHLRISARRRLDIFLDKEDRQELATEVQPIDRLKFKDIKKYKDRIKECTNCNKKIHRDINGARNILLKNYKEYIKFYESTSYDLFKRLSPSCLCDHAHELDDCNIREIYRS